MKKVSLIVFTDGRTNCLSETLLSFHEKVQYVFTEKIIINDCLGEHERIVVDSLAEKYGFLAIHNNVKIGFSGVYNLGWSIVSKESDYLFNLEDDFTFNEEIDINSMINIIDKNPYLIQLVLKRQAWNDEEKKVGGIIEQWAELYEEKEIDGIKWSEHNLFYSTNPSLTPRWVFEKGWVLGNNSEAKFSQKIFSEGDYKSAYLGGKFDTPKVHHIGQERVSNIGY
jgi:hypothetical protein